MQEKLTSQLATLLLRHLPWKRGAVLAIVWRQAWFCLVTKRLTQGPRQLFDYNALRIVPSDDNRGDRNIGREARLRYDKTYYDVRYVRYTQGPSLRKRPCPRQTRSATLDC